MSKCGLIEGFGQNVCKLPMGINVAQIDVPFIIMISKKFKANIDVLGLRMEHEIFGNANGAHAITKQRHIRKLQAKIPQDSHHPSNYEQQLATTTYLASVVDWATLDYL